MVFGLFGLESRRSAIGSRDELGISTKSRLIAKVHETRNKGVGSDARNKDDERIRWEFCDFGTEQARMTFGDLECRFSRKTVVDARRKKR